MGEGEFGPVYRAIARGISPKEQESIVAVKILMPREGDEDYQPEMALADFASQMKLSSDYVASIVGICADTEPYYVIYQYLSEVCQPHVFTRMYMYVLHVFVHVCTCTCGP